MTQDHSRLAAEIQARILLNKAMLYEVKARELIKQYHPGALNAELPKLVQMMLEMAIFIAKDIEDDAKQISENRPAS